MTRWDVFNGDADGLCAVQQWRLAEPAPDAVPVTGAKRDVVLLARVGAAPGDAVTVFDVSLHANRSALESVLASVPVSVLASVPASPTHPPVAAGFSVPSALGSATGERLMPNPIDTPSHGLVESWSLGASRYTSA